MIVSIKNLKELGACREGTEYALAHLNGMDASIAINGLIKADKLEWANWAISRLISKENRIRYAIYAASHVIKIYEDKYPSDTRPRDAINAAKRYLKTQTEKNRAAANAASYAAYAAANVASYAASNAASNAAYAAYAAANAAANAASNAAYAAYAAANAAYAASNAAMKKNIICYGLRLLSQEAPK
jgi:hypothetical protein